MCIGVRGMLRGAAEAQWGQDRVPSDADEPAPLSGRVVAHLSAIVPVTRSSPVSPPFPIPVPSLSVPPPSSKVSGRKLKDELMSLDVRDRRGVGKRCLAECRKCGHRGKLQMTKARETEEETETPETGRVLLAQGRA